MLPSDVLDLTRQMLKASEQARFRYEQDQIAIAKGLRALRIQMKMSGCEMARRLNTSRETIYFLEAGRRRWDEQWVMRYLSALQAFHHRPKRKVKARARLCPPGRLFKIWQNAIDANLARAA